ncbi:MAG: hypothetical protein NXI24_02440 [bacterium]|nr:hypothetical protein [bacterium]
MLCPAKINLGLQVHHRRAADGYHFISSIFLPIDFGDTLTITEVPGSPAESDRLTTDNELPDAIRADFELVSERSGSEADAPGGSSDSQRQNSGGAPASASEANLVWRALAETQDLRDTALHAHLIKRVPTGGGLGGGSSDAGTLLAWIRDRFDRSNDELLPIASKLGADVPFFLHGKPALLHGTGDIIEEIQVGAGLGVLCFPMLKIDTGIAYSQLKRTLQPAPPPRILSGLRTDTRAALARSDWNAVRDDLNNDFEAPAFAMHTSLGSVKKAFFDHGARFASLSGSGSSLYGLVSDKTEQQRVLERMQKQFSDFRFQPFQFAGSASTNSDSR